MRWYRLLKYDFQNGVLHNWTFCLAPFGALLLCRQCHQILSLYGLSGTWATYLMYCFKGLETISRQTLSGGLQVPILWMMILILPLLICLNYPYQDMKTVGPQILMRSGSRIHWWCAKCVWNVSCTVIYFLSIYLTVALYCLCNKIPVTMAVSAQSILALFSQAEITDSVQALTVGQIAFVAILLPFLVAAALDMLEMLLSLFFRPAYSFLLCVAVVAGSAYATTPVLIGNFANLTRCGLFVNHGLNSKVGIVLCLGVLVGSVVSGVAFFRRQNILPDYKEL